MFNSISKNLVKNGFYFEQDPIKTPLTLIESIWMDSDKIPNTLPLLEELDDEGYFTLIVNNNPLKILQKTSCTLHKISDYIYQNDDFKNVLTPWFNDANYPIYLTDENNNAISLITNRIKIDTVSGTILIGAYNQEIVGDITVEYWKYVGRNKVDAFLDTNGLNKMIDTYIPIEEQDVSTKKYVDQQIELINASVKGLKPSSPKTINEVETFAINMPQGRLINEALVLPVCREGSKLKITAECFYIKNPTEFSIQILIDNTLFSEQYFSIENPRETNTITSEYFNANFIDYSSLVRATPMDWFYCFNNFNIEIPFENLTTGFASAKHTIQIIYKDPFSSLEGNIVEFATDWYLNDHIFEQPTYTLGEVIEKTISGITYIEPTTLSINFNAMPFQNIVGPKNIELQVFNDTYILDIINTIYTSISPTINLSKTINIPYNIQGIPIKIRVYGVDGQQLINFEDNLNLQTTSLQPDIRFNCGEPYSEPTEINQNINLFTNNNLQYTKEGYVFPKEDYSEYNKLFGYTFTPNPNYSYSDTASYRGLTKKFIIEDTCFGGKINLIGAQNISFKNNTPENFEVYIKNENTGWLKCLPWSLNSTPSNDGDHCLICNQDKNNLRVTFQQNLTGTFYIKILFYDKSCSIKDITFLPLID